MLSIASSHCILTKVVTYILKFGSNSSGKFRWWLGTKTTRPGAAKSTKST